MQNESIKEEVINIKPSSEVLQQEIKKKNGLSIIIVISILVLMYIIFRKSEFVSFFIAISIPFVIIYLTSRNVYKEVSSYKMMTRPTFYLSLFIFNIISFFIVMILINPDSYEFGGLITAIFIIFCELIFDIISIAIYELILKYKIKTGKIN